MKFTIEVEVKKATDGRNWTSEIVADALREEIETIDLCIGDSGYTVENAVVR